MKNKNPMQKGGSKKGIDKRLNQHLSGLFEKNPTAKRKAKANERKPAELRKSVDTRIKMTKSQKRDLESISNVSGDSQAEVMRKAVQCYKQAMNSQTFLMAGHIFDMKNKRIMRSAEPNPNAKKRF